MPNIKVTKHLSDWYDIDWQITVSNLTGNDLRITDLPLRWITSSIQKSGKLYGYESYCELKDNSNAVIPPSYTDTLDCHSVASFETTDDVKGLWIGFSLEDGTHFLQAIPN